MVKKQVRNQHTGAGSITQREAETIQRCMAKVMKIAMRDNLYVGQVRDLNDAWLAMRDALQKADRWFN